MRFNLKAIITVLICFYSILSVDAQLLLTDYYAAKVEDDKLKIRWEPLNVRDWAESKRSGYVLEITTIQNGIEETFLKKEVVEVSNKQAWEKLEDNCMDFRCEYITNAKEFIYPSPQSSGNRFDKIFNLEGNQEKNDKLNMGFFLYASSFEFELSKLAGLGYEMSYEQGKVYKFRVYVKGGEALEFIINPSLYKEAEIPDVTAEWNDKAVELKWKGGDLQGSYLGYVVSVSEDGVNYQLQNEKPRTNNLGLVADTSALLNISFKDSLVQNDKLYYYQVKGFDYFGEHSKTNKIVFGSGFKPLGISPIIEYADQTEDNHAKLKWYMPRELDDKVARYRILRADRDEGPYTIIKDSIPNTTKEVEIPMETTENHFKVEAVPHRGRPAGTFPVFIMGQDTVPPATPVIIGAYLDSAGVVAIEWEENTEPDLAGYRVFKSNFDSQEFNLIDASPTMNTFFRDTVDLEFHTEEVLYRVHAVDTRYNRSPLSEIIRVKKPDLLPPGTPVLLSLEQSNDSLLINWSPSFSRDVVMHHLYRRNLKSDEAWTLIGILKNEAANEPFIETNLEYDIPYAYTIIAFDDAGLKSEPASPRNIVMKKVEEKFEAILSFKHSLDDNKNNITLSWELNQEKMLEKVLVYKGDSKDRIGRYKYVNPNQSSFTEQVDFDQKAFYMIKPIYKDQKEDYVSETIEVEVLK